MADMNIRWPEGWTKPVYRRRWRNLSGYISLFTPKKVGISGKLGPLSLTDGGRLYLFGARIDAVLRRMLMGARR